MDLRVKVFFIDGGNVLLKLLLCIYMFFMVGNFDSVFKFVDGEKMRNVIYLIVFCYEVLKEGVIYVIESYCRNYYYYFKSFYRRVLNLKCCYICSDVFSEIVIIDGELY